MTQKIKFFFMLFAFGFITTNCSNMPTITTITDTYHQDTTLIKWITQRGLDATCYKSVIFGGKEYIAEDLGSDYRSPIFELELAPDEKPDIIEYHPATSSYYKLLCPISEIISGSPINSSGFDRPSRISSLDNSSFGSNPLQASSIHSVSTIAAMISQRSSIKSFDQLTESKK